jgi:preprotein translocase SecF subunit
MKFWPFIKVLPVRTHFRFVRLARVFSSLSVLAIIGSLFLTLYPFKPPCGGLACGIDFQGGTVMDISTAPQAADPAKIHAALQGLNLNETVQTAGAPGAAILRFEAPKGADISATVTRVEAALTKAFGTVKFASTDVVGPTVSGELLTKGLLGLGLAILAMLLYIWFRFELQFGLGAVAALFHDVFLTFGLIAIMGRFGKIEFDLRSVAAILTIIGYSMNDTVVVFDRFRENLRKYKSMPLGEVIDMSINEMLTRTIITSMTAVLALLALAFFGGPTLYGLSVIMLFGIAIGTYSSIYIAAPVIMLWGVKRGGVEEPAEPLKPQTVR